MNLLPNFGNSWKIEEKNVDLATYFFSLVVSGRYLLVPNYLTKKDSLGHVQLR